MAAPSNVGRRVSATAPTAMRPTGTIVPISAARSFVRSIGRSVARAMQEVADQAAQRQRRKNRGVRLVLDAVVDLLRERSAGPHYAARSPFGSRQSAVRIFRRFERRLLELHDAPPE